MRYGEGRKRDREELAALNMLSSAIKKVPSQYIIETYSNKQSEVLMVERSFAYELYHQIKIELRDNSEKYSNLEPLILHAEITKEMEDTHWYPDLVLHHGQISLGNQLMVCEIKRFKNHLTPFKTIKDLKKISDYIEKLTLSGVDAHFKLGVFISITKSKIENLRMNLVDILDNPKLSKYSEDIEEIKKAASKIWIFSVFTDNSSLCNLNEFNLGKIIEEIENTNV